MQQAVDMVWWMDGEAITMLETLPFINQESC